MEHIESGMADTAAVERRDHRGFVDQRAARGVDQDRAGFHAGDPRCVEEAACLVIQREIE